MVSYLFWLGLGIGANEIANLIKYLHDEDKTFSRYLKDFEKNYELEDAIKRATEAARDELKNKKYCGLLAYLLKKNPMPATSYSEDFGIFLQD